MVITLLMVAESCWIQSVNKEGEEYRKDWVIPTKYAMIKKPRQQGDEETPEAH